MKEIYKWKEEEHEKFIKKFHEENRLLQERTQKLNEGEIELRLLTNKL